MLIYQKYLLKRILLYFYVIFAVSTVLVWLIKANAILAFVISKGIGIMNFVIFSSLALPEIISSLLPITLFIALIMSYQSVYSNREIYALKNCGLGEDMLMKPALFFSIAIFLLHLLLDFFVIPSANSLQYNKKMLFENRFSNIPIEEKVFVHPVKNIVIYCGKKESSGLLKDIFINDNSNINAKIVIHAKAGEFVYMDGKNFLVLYDGVREQIFIKSHEIEKFMKLYFDISIKDYVKTSSHKRNKDLNIIELIVSARENPTKEIITEIYNRIFFPVLNILLALISTYLVLTRYQYIKPILSSIAIYLINFLIFGYFMVLTKIYQPEIAKIFLSFISFLMLYGVTWYKMSASKRDR